MAKEMFQKYSKNKITLEKFAVLEAFVCYPHLNAGTLAKTLIREKSYVESILAKLIKKGCCWKSSQKTMTFRFNITNLQILERGFITKILRDMIK